MQGMNAKKRSKNPVSRAADYSSHGPEIYSEASPEMEEAAFAIVDKIGARYDYDIGLTFDVERHYRELAELLDYDIHRMASQLNIPPLGNRPVEDAAECQAARFYELELMHEAGLRHAPLLALEDAVRLGMPVPTWASDVILRGIVRWSRGLDKTLDEAMGVQRPKNWDQEAAQKRFQKLARVVDAVERLRKERPVDDLLFDEVGEGHSVSGATVKRWYYEYKRRG